MAASVGLRSPRIGAAVAAALTLAVLIACAVVGHAAWRAWLGAAFFCISLPIGALGLIMIMRLIPGLWAREAAPFLEAQMLLAPIGALALIPVLIALPALYPWVGEPQQTPFRRLWLSPPVFILVTAAWIAIVFAMAWLLARRPDAPRAAACIGLILFALLDTFAATDWLQSLDPAFNSSGFGLYVISLQMLLGLAGAMAYAFVGRQDVPRRGILGGLLLMLLLMWAYFAYMPYFISWSGNVPTAAVWYLRRGRGVWAWLAWLVAASRFVPAFLLLFSTIRTSRRWLFWLSLTVLMGGAAEVAWIVLPSPPGGAPADPLTAILFVFASGGLGSLSAMLAPQASAWLEARS